MFSLIRGLFGVAILAAAGYVLFFLPVGGQSIAAHFGDIWKSPVVQNKIGAIKDDVRTKLEAELERRESDTERAARWARENEVEISEDDRKELEALLRAELE